MKLSAIMPVYNPLEHFDLVLASLCAQTVVVDELIVTDDGSEEDVLSVLQARRSSLPFPVVYVRQSREGARRARCRNNGIRVAEGEALFFLDQDILFTPGYVEVFKSHLHGEVFLVGYPIRLSERQSEGVSVDDVRLGVHRCVPMAHQRRRLRAQYAKDFFAYLMRPVLPAIGYRPKLRSGVFGIARRCLDVVNGFDETYEGWGNEDDDLGRRLYRVGVRGRNTFLKEFALHLHHPLAEIRAARVNRDYYLRRKAEIAGGDFVAPRGIRNPIQGDEPHIVRLD